MLEKFHTWLDDPYDYMTSGEQVVYFKHYVDLGAGKNPGNLEPKDVSSKGYSIMVKRMPVEMLMNYYKCKLDAVWAGENSKEHIHFVRVREALRSTFYRVRQVKLGRVPRVPQSGRPRK